MEPRDLAAGLIAGLDLSVSPPPAEVEPRPRRRRQREHEAADEDERPRAVPRLMPGYILSDDGKWAYGPKDPREGVKLARRRERLMREARAMEREPVMETADEGDCIMCAVLEDVAKGTPVSAAVRLMNRMGDSWVNGRTEERIAIDLARLWNRSIYPHGRRLQLDIPELTPEQVLRHRRKCLVRDVDADLVETIGQQTELADAVRESQVYRFAIRDDGSMDDAAQVDPKGARLWLSAELGKCRTVREARGAVSSSMRGANALAKKMGAARGARAGEKPSGGGMTVMRAGGVARAPV